MCDASPDAGAAIAMRDKAATLLRAETRDTPKPRDGLAVPPLAVLTSAAEGRRLHPALRDGLERTRARATRHSDGGGDVLAN